MMKRKIKITALIFLFLCALALGACDFFSVSEKQLDTPKNLSIDSETKMLTWDAVEDAEGYDIDIDGNEYFTETNSYSLDTVLYTVKTYVIKVRASAGYGLQTGNIKYTSEWSQIQYTTAITEKLPAPTNIILNEAQRKLTWDRVRYADRYDIEITDDEGREYSVIGNYTAEWYLGMSMFTSIRTHSIKVMARYSYNSAYNSDWSETVSYTVVNIISKMAAPTNLQLHDKILTWDDVEGAGNPLGARYTVFVKTNGSLLYSQTNSFADNRCDLSDILRAPRKYEIYVETIGTHFADSDLSEMLEYDLRMTHAVPQNIRLDGKTLKWDAVQYPQNSGIIGTVSNYIIEIDGTEYETTENKYTLSAGFHDVRIKSKGNITNFLNSDFSAISRFDARDKLYNPSGTYAENRNLVWNGQEGAVGYVIEVDGTTYELTKPEYSFEEYLLGNNYEVKIMAKGNGTTTVDSDWTALFTVVLSLPTEKVTIENEYRYGYCISWDAVPFAYFYILDVNGDEYSLAYLYKYLVFSEAGEYTVKVKAEACVYTKSSMRYVVFESEYCEITFTAVKLSVPENVSLDGTVLKWDAVAGAAGYEIFISSGDFEYPYSFRVTEDTEYDLDFISEWLDYYEVEICNILIRAVGDETLDSGTYVINSDWSQTIEIKKEPHTEDIEV